MQKGNGVYYNKKGEEIPNLLTWVPTDEQKFFTIDHDIVIANYSETFNINPDSSISQFVIIKNHFKSRMPDVVQHINYFLNFFDEEKELYLSILSVKFNIDQYRSMSYKVFTKLIMKNVVTDSFITKIRDMADSLYQLNINTDKDGKYKTTPKITNAHAKELVAISFAMRMILPLCIHYSNINSNFVAKRDYIACFDKVFTKLVNKFEETGIPIFDAVCRFVKYRVDRAYNSDSIIWNKKKQLSGITYEEYFQTLIHEVILVKSLYKLTYTRSVVSFIDGILTHSYNHFKYENFKFKPVEIENDDSSGDEEDYLSHAESLEMSIYRIDESNILINDVNTAKVLESMSEKFNIKISDEEFEFYNKHCVFNFITKMLMHAFYSRYFKDSNAINALNREETIKLLIYMKKFLMYKGMVILPQICTGKIKGKYKDNTIKNCKFIEKLETSSVYNNIIRKKYRLIDELNDKDNVIIKRLSTIINSTFIIIDYDDQLTDYVYSDVNIDMIIDEFMLFLSII